MMKSREPFPQRLTCWTTSSVFRRPWKTLLQTFVLLLTAVENSQPTTTRRDTRVYSMSRAVCNGVFRNVAAAIVEGSGSLGKIPTLCDVTLATPEENSYWMLRFERAVIQDCSVVVTIFDSSIHPANQPPVLNMGCADRDPGILFLNSSTTTIRLRHRNATDYTFRIALTAIATGDSKCQAFQCDNGVCMSMLNLCDGVDNCFDGSDESHNGTSRCYDSYWPLQGENWGVLASVLGVALVIGFMAACCRHIKRKKHSAIDDLYEINGGPYVHRYAYRYAIIRPPKKPNKTNVVLGRDGHMHYTSTTV